MIINVQTTFLTRVNSKKNLQLHKIKKILVNQREAVSIWTQIIEYLKLINQLNTQESVTFTSIVMNKNNCQN